MRPYMVHAGDESKAVLAFAWSEREARRVVFEQMDTIGFFGKWVKIRATWIRNRPDIEALHTTEQKPFMLRDWPRDEAG